MSDAETTNDAIFDPEIHATDRDGNPSLNKDGSFRKKRKDAGRTNRRAKSGPSAGTTRSKSSSTGGAAGAARAKYIAAVNEAAALPVAGLSLVDPVMGYAAGELAPMWAEVLGDMAVERPRLAAALERLGSLGTGGNLAMLGVVTVVTFGSLSGKLKVPEGVLTGMGIKSRAEIEQILHQRGQAMAAQRQEAEAEARVRAAQGPADADRAMAYA